LKGPVKIGITGRESKTGRANLSGGNWRVLEVLHREYIAPDELRWHEWLIHQHLRPHHVRGEWYRVRGLLTPRSGWSGLLRRAYAGTLPSCQRWRLGDSRHHLVLMRRLTTAEPRQFDATCSCGHTIVGPEGRGLASVQVQFAVEHLGYDANAPAVKALRTIDAHRRPRPIASQRS
jgi:hypothetical protein